MYDRKKQLFWNGSDWMKSLLDTSNFWFREYSGRVFFLIKLEVREVIQEDFDLKVASNLNASKASFEATQLLRTTIQCHILEKFSQRRWLTIRIYMSLISEV